MSEELKTDSPVRYEVEVRPSFYDIIRQGKIHVYHFERPVNPEEGTWGANPGNVGNMLRNIRKGDSLVFWVSKERRGELGNKGAEYTHELERVVDSIETKSDTVYLYWKKQISTRN